MPASTDKLNPQDNLHQFTANAVLAELKYMQGVRAPPKPPKPGHKSHRNLLHIRPEQWRVITSVYKLNLSAFKERVVKCTFEIGHR
jgi:hypothetical protein